jgi:hypothetical protein
MTDQAVHLQTATVAPLAPEALPRRQEQEETNTTVNVRAATLAMVTAFALFGLFGTQGMRQFSRDLPGNALTDMLVSAADRWHALMLDLGPAKLEPSIRGAIERARALRW